MTQGSNGRHFLNDLLNRWRIRSQIMDGLFRPDIDEFWKPVSSERPITLVSQCRLIYTMSAGWNLTGDGFFPQSRSNRS